MCRMQENNNDRADYYYYDGDMKSNTPHCTEYNGPRQPKSKGAKSAVLNAAQ